MRSSCANWCNIRGAGIGVPPTVQTAVPYLVDAYFWLKTPGESDGCTQQTASDPSLANPELPKLGSGSTTKSSKRGALSNYSVSLRFPLAVAVAVAPSPSSVIFANNRYEQLYHMSFWRILQCAPLQKPQMLHADRLQLGSSANSITPNPTTAPTNIPTSPTATSLVLPSSPTIQTTSFPSSSPPVFVSSAPTPLGAPNIMATNVLSTSGNQIVDSNGKSVRLIGINW
eukprot:gene22742-29446_t